ncbi:MAG TPA: outer membrane beta-barrel protein, partial [Bacteroidia bacterium]|nr:outer membrane beta-barrel protein [Bacteroidia bacterium]
YYEPWWQAGGRLTYRPNEEFKAVFYVVNGYNQFVAVNKNKAAGLAISYALGDNGSIAYNDFISDDTPDNVHVSHTRFLNNLVFTYTFFKKLIVLVGVDLITQQHSKLSDSTKTAIVNSYILTLKYQFTKPWSIYTRGEIYNDPSGFLSGIIIDANGYLTGYIMGGLTLGTEFKPTETSYIRLEGRQLNMDEGQNIFYTNGKYVNKRDELMVTLGIWF